jgi:TolB-like protein/class 3 adenylate cyclase/Tfp pilus assembly protein PilF
MSANAEQRKLAAIMFTDMVGYSALSQRDDKLALELLEEHRQLLREIFPRFNGTEIKTIGDAFLVEFNSALEAAQCAIEIQRALAKRNADAPAARQVELKIGIHIGDVVHRGGDVYGDGVNIASRIEPLAGAGGICVSMDVERQIRNAVETRFEKLAPTELKNISLPMDLFRIVLPWEKKSEVRDQKSAVRERVAASTGRRFAWIGGLALLLIVGIGWWWTTLPHKNPASPAPEGSQPKNVPEKSIAVLPFESLSEDKANAYFAEGVQDEILTKLASIADLKVISRTSTAKYKSKPEDLKVVSQQLGVATVLEGTVQRAADKVRVNVQLIDARADSHLWAKSFDRDIKDVFAVESEVSQEIADALQAKLSPNEASTLATSPTNNPEAYDLFLKAEYEEREADSSLKAEPFDRAAVFYQQALERDSTFALAAARLAENRILRHWFVKRLSESELPEIETMAQHAVALGPDLAEAHIALGSFYYYGKLDYADALQEFGRALKLQPNSAGALERCAYIYRRQGQWERALSGLAKCQERDPQNGLLARETGSTYCYLRMWPEAKRAASRSLALDPHGVSALHTLLICSLNGAGDISEAKRALGMFPQAPRIINFLSLSTSSTGPYFYVIERDYGGALKACEKEIADPDENRSRLVTRVAIHVLAGDTDRAHDEIEQARTLLERRLADRPNDAFAVMQMSWVNLALDRKAGALHLAQQATDLNPVEKDAPTGVAFQTALAEIQARAGEAGEAVKTLGRLLAIPAGFHVSIAQLKIDPIWDPIRNDPSFQRLLAGKEQVGPVK